jgi:hypothetical protein
VTRLSRLAREGRKSAPLIADFDILGRKAASVRASGPHIFSSLLLLHPGRAIVYQRTGINYGIDTASAIRPNIINGVRF